MSADTENRRSTLALIVRNRIHWCLKKEMRKLGKRPDYMAVPAALQELEKTGMVRLTDNRYHLDHAVTKALKTILNASGMDADTVKHGAEEVGSNSPVRSYSPKR